MNCPLCDYEGYSSSSPCPFCWGIEFAVDEHWKRNLGAILSGAMALEREEAEHHDDMRLFYAPGACHRGVHDGFNKLREEYWDFIEKVWGVTKKEVEKEFKKRVNWTYNMHCIHAYCF